MTQQKKVSIGPILFLYYEESLVSSNFNSNLLRFHCAHPNLYVICYAPGVLKFYGSFMASLFPNKIFHTKYARVLPFLFSLQYHNKEKITNSSKTQKRFNEKVHFIYFGCK